MDATQTSAISEKKRTVPVETLAFGENSFGRRGEIDTSAPFESVKEAVDRFGGSAVWNSQLRMLFLPKKRHCFKEFEVLNVQEQAGELEKGPFIKEPQVPKRSIFDFEPQLQKEETSEVNTIPAVPSSGAKFHPNSQNEKENLFIGTFKGQSSGSVLDELELAKMNLSRTTCDLTKIRAFIEALYSEIDSERTIHEKTPEKLSSLETIVSFLEEDLKKTTLKLQISEEAKDNRNRDPADVSREIEQLRSQIQQFRQTAKAAKSEASKLASEIEKMQAGIKTAEIRRLAAKKMEEAAKAAEAVAIARIKDIMNSNSSDLMIVTPEFERHCSRKKIEASAIVDVEASNLSKLDLVAKMKEAAAEVKTSRQVLEDALNRFSKFKNCSYSNLLEINGFNLTRHTPTAGVTHALSIGEILSKKLIGLEEYEHAIREICEISTDEKKAKLSLGQILNRKPGLLPPLLVGRFAYKQQPLKRKRKKFGFVGLA